MECGTGGTPEFTWVCQERRELEASGAAVRGDSLALTALRHTASPHL